MVLIPSQRLSEKSKVGMVRQAHHERQDPFVLSLSKDNAKVFTRFRQPLRWTFSNAFLLPFIGRIGYKGWVGCEYEPETTTIRRPGMGNAVSIRPERVGLND